MKYLDTELHWPTTTPPPIAQALLRVQPEDFAVEEINHFELTGAGEHLWLHVRKRGANTEFVARALARAAGVAARAVSYAGMKDRHAVTTQWFSVQLPGRADPEFAGKLPAQIELLAMRRHARKLQRGALKGNRFRIVLRDCHGDAAALQRRIEDIGRFGVPNYFGEQRFGREGDNLARADEMFRGAAVDRHRRGIYLSAARSLIFNELLARRVADGSWCRVLDGDVLMLHRTNSYFVPEEGDENIAQRLQAGDVHPSGPLWGEGEPPSRGPVRALEQESARRYPLLADGLADAGLAQERRALRLLPERMAAQWVDPAVLQLEFALPAGCYATAVLREIADYRDMGGAALADGD